MADLLTRLGVPTDIRSWFDIEDSLFTFGDDHEHFGETFHRVPTTKNLWTAGNHQSPEVIITFSAMEAVAYLTLNCHLYSKPYNLLFIAIGNLPHSWQLEWIRLRYKNRKFTLVLGKDLLGRLCDVFIAARICNKVIKMTYTDAMVKMSYRGNSHIFDPETITLGKVERVLGIRTRIRTKKPASANSFLEQLSIAAQVRPEKCAQICEK
ncbi:hypothetical protein GCM10023149_50440 [Mucilaginibacter gynuensis]|uniref:Uncharacterized protein n=1 Tax=Mucilaginibacter gynuensis TaxID=1302236 RepID=A0ABP8HI25_9SPHI